MSEGTVMGLIRRLFGVREELPLEIATAPVAPVPPPAEMPVAGAPSDEESWLL